MVLEENSDVILDIAVLLGLSIIAAIILLILTVSILRLKLIRTGRRQQAFINEWKKIFDETVENSIPATLPRIKNPDRFTFLALWIRSIESNTLDEQGRARLQLLFKKVGGELAANQMLKSGKTKLRLAAIIALGHTQKTIEWGELYNTAFSTDPFISLVAARALVHIDTQKAAPIFLDLIKQHDDWPTSKVMGILNEIGPRHITTSLINLIAESPPDVQKKLIPFLAACEQEQAVNFARKLLKAPQDDIIIAPCIRILTRLKDEQSAPVIRPYLTHERWHIRVMAANYLGVVGNIDDKDLLAPLLYDKQWWVRYRAAQAIARLPDITGEILRQLGEALTDKYGKEILLQVAAEMDMPEHD